VIFFGEEKTTKDKGLSASRIDDNGSRLGDGGAGANNDGSDRALDSDSPVRLHDVVNSSGTMGEPKVRRRYTWTCQFCGAEFETEKYTKRYCSPTHKQRAYELRKEQRADILTDA
jgi:hypothetical protein